jgi:hypothetical protein
MEHFKREIEEEVENEEQISIEINNGTVNINGQGSMTINGKGPMNII